MAILALVTKEEQIEQVLPWAERFACALNTKLTVLCWAYGVTTDPSKWESLMAQVLRCCAEPSEIGTSYKKQTSPLVCVEQTDDLDPVRAATALAAREEYQLLVAAGEDQSAGSGAGFISSELLRRSPCHTIVLFGGLGRSLGGDRIFVGSNERYHCIAGLYLADRLSQALGTQVTLARKERDYDGAGIEVGHRELREMIREAGVADDEAIRCLVFRATERIEVSEVMEEHDLVLLPPVPRLVRMSVAYTSRPTIGVIKRAPRLQRWRRRSHPMRWISGLTTKDYADLYQGLRRGSGLSADFLTMLGLAAVVASFGLLQGSPAVVIGSMLLAPLMTPMLGCGLALAQANPGLGNRALASVSVGLLQTLVISALIGWLTPGSQLSEQVLARGHPTVLDLGVAVASATAAAYALARPGLIGSIAGVAIATALVPPLCSVGLSIAYGDSQTASGAGLLFGTNFVAIVLSAALTFRMMGVTAGQAGPRQHSWVRRIGAMMAVASVLICIPLYIGLQRSLVTGLSQPTTYPLTRPVIEALEEYIKREPDIELISAGRPSSPHDPSDIILVLGSPRTPDEEYVHRLAQIVRRELGNDALVVEVHSVAEHWMIEVH